MGSAPQYDWHQIRTEYVEGITRDGQHIWPSLGDLAKEYGAHPSTVRNRAAQENWAVQQRAFKEQLEQQRQAARIEAMSGAAAEFDSSCLDAARQAVRAARKMIDRILEAVEAFRPTKKKGFHRARRACSLPLGRLAMPKTLASRPWAVRACILTLPVCWMLLALPLLFGPSSLPSPTPSLSHNRALSLTSQRAALPRIKPQPFAFKPFSSQALRLVSWWHPSSPYADLDGVIADGSVRSSKTISALVGWSGWATTQFQYESFIVAGRSMGALERNVLSPWRRILTAMGLPYSDQRGEDRHIQVGTNKFYLFGANNERSRDTLKGLTAAGAFADEVALFPRSFFEEMLARLSVDGAKLWATCNPEGPYHWLKTEVIDKARSKHLLRLHFTLDDNLSLSQAVKRRLKRSFTGVWYKRYIEGLWVLAEGIIYDAWHDGLIIPCPDGLRNSIVAIDYGTTNPTTFGLYRWDAGTPVHLAREYWHDSLTAGRQKTDAEYCRDLKRWLGSEQPEAIYVDPSAASFIAALEREGLPVVPAVNDVLDGIRYTHQLIADECFLVDPSCSNTIREFGGYVWDEKAQARGEDAPVKAHDHAMDRNRYALYSHWGSKKEVTVTWL